MAALRSSLSMASFHKLATISIVCFLFHVPSAVAFKRETAMNLARARINDARLALSEVNADNLGNNCKDNLKSVQAGLVESEKLLMERKDEELSDKLDGVAEELDTCVESLARVGTSTATDTRMILRAVSRSVSNAEKLVELAKSTATMGQISPETVDSTSPLTGPNVKPSSTPLTSIAVDFCADHVTLQSNTATVRLDKSCGAKFHSKTMYYSGVFSARIRTPVKATGIINSFYISSNDQLSDQISFDFMGNYPNRISTNYAVNGNATGNQELFVVPFDCSVDFHTYSIKWDSESIMWIVDSTVLRQLTRTNAPRYPVKPGSVYFYTWDASYVASGTYAGRIDWTKSPFRTYFTDISVTSPLAPGTWKPPAMATTSSLIPIPMRPLAIDYCFSNIAVTANDISIAFDRGGCGGRFRSIINYPSGTFVGNVKCAAGDTSGLISSLYLSSQEGSNVQDEIDFEWLGKDKTGVQTNYYVNGQGGNEVIVDLGFDCSQAYHTYTIVYNSDQIQWLVDNRVVRVVTRAQQQLFNRPYPVKPVYLYASVWNASSVEDGRWAGKWKGQNLPYTVYYSDIRIRSP